MSHAEQHPYRYQLTEEQFVTVQANANLTRATFPAAGFVCYAASWDFGRCTRADVDVVIDNLCSTVEVSRYSYACHHLALDAQTATVVGRLQWEEL